MRKTVTTTTITCDICGKEVEDYKLKVSENRKHLISEIITKHYYGMPYLITDICPECSEAIDTVIQKLCAVEMRGTLKGRRISGIKIIEDK